MKPALEETSPTADPESSMLFGFWYRAARSDGIKRATMARARILDTPLVVGRDRSGRAFAMLDVCPHRGMPLSYGWFDGETVQCSYHGWKFDAQTAQCLFIPSIASGQELDVGKIRAGHMACEERDGFVWVYFPRPEPSGALSRREPPPGPAPALPVHSERYRSFCLTSFVPIAADHGLTSLLDPAHGAFVHANAWWFARLTLGIHPNEGEGAPVRDLTRDFVPRPLGFREESTQPVTAGWFRRLAGADVTTVTADFVLPGHRLAEIRTGKYWISGFATVTPVTTESCRIDVIIAWDLFYWWPWAAAMFKFLFWVFFVQDRRTMARQAEGLRQQSRLLFVDDADTTLRWYYQIKREYLESRRAARPFEHPLRDKATLTWRSPQVGDIVRQGAPRPGK